MNLRPVTRTAMLLAALTLPVAAVAQQAAPARAPRGQSLAARVEQRLGRLHDALGITPAEEGLWNQYAEVTRANARDMGQAFAARRAGIGAMSAVDNMRSLAGMAAQHAQNMQRLAAAFDRLYDALPPGQRKVADEVFRGFSARP